MSIKKKMVMLMGKLRKSLSFFSTHKALDRIQSMETIVPVDVKEGQFVVFVIKGEEIGRFVIELSYLTNPAFMKLLDLAEEEYGFKQTGALAIPCRLHDLNKILRVSSIIEGL